MGKNRFYYYYYISPYKHQNDGEADADGSGSTPVIARFFPRTCKYTQAEIHGMNKLFLHPAGPNLSAQGNAKGQRNQQGLAGLLAHAPHLRRPCTHQPVPGGPG